MTRSKTLKSFQSILLIVFECQRYQQQLRNAPLIEGRLAPSKEKKGKRRLLLVFFAIIILIVVVLVPSLLITQHKNNNDNANLPTTLLSISPSQSLEPSFTPSISLIPSSFPSTSSPTSTTFANVVNLLGLDQNSVSLTDPNDYVCIFRSIRWMAKQDQFTRAMLLRPTEKIQATLLQRFALVCLYYATMGESWNDRLGFLNPLTSECQWQVFGRDQFLRGGATINCIDNVITGIALNDNNLGGVLPTEIGLLTRLTKLELRKNQIGSTLPLSLSQLSQLVALSLDRNGFSGSIPSEITTLNNLGILLLQLNDLTGSIPASIGDLDNLALFAIMSNAITGSIPSWIEK